MNARRAGGIEENVFPDQLKKMNTEMISKTCRNYSLFTTRYPAAENNDDNKLFKHNNNKL